MFEGLLPICIKDDKQIYGLRETGHALSVLRVPDDKALERLLMRREALLNDAGHCVHLNIPRNQRIEKNQSGLFLIEEMELGSMEGSCQTRTDDFLAALSELHSAGWVHMDIKPDHLLWVNGCWKLHDFDGAMPMGTTFDRRDITFEYAPPDVLWHTRSDTRDDLYAAALVLYLWKCGKLPFGAKSRIASAIRKRVVRSIPIPDSWGEEAKIFFRNALNPNRRRRTENTEEWINAYKQVELIWKARENDGEHV